jgi:hypothetical protein
MVSSDGAITRSQNATARQAATGVYCITPDPAVVPVVTQAVIVATTDFSDASGHDIAQGRSSGIGCNAGEMTVRMWDTSVTGNETATNAGFFFVIP